MNAQALFITNLICSIYMVGVIWVIQLIHYPSFLSIDALKFSDFHHKHSQVMGLLVGPVMVLELISALGMVLWQSSATSVQSNFEIWVWINLALVVSLWVLTFFVSVPIHNQLASGFSEKLIHQLVLTNWPRTIVWTLKAILLVLFMRGKL